MAASVDIILYYAFPHNSYHSCAATILAKLYSNSLLAIFNSRIKIVGGRDWRSSDPAGHLEVSYDTRGQPRSGLGPIVFRTDRTATTTDTYSHGAPSQEDAWPDADGVSVKDRVRFPCSRKECHGTNEYASRWNYLQASSNRVHSLAGRQYKTFIECVLECDMGIRTMRSAALPFARTLHNIFALTRLE